MTLNVKTVLFISSGNSGRSIMAESVLRKLGLAHFDGHSAGSFPTRRVNPLALEVLRLHGYPTDGLTSKSWHGFIAAPATPIHFVIKVAASAPQEKSPLWPGSPQLLEWDFPDPGALQGTDLEIREAFAGILEQIEVAIIEFIAAHRLAHVT